MKLRIKGDSIRLRLSQGEIGELAAAGSVEDGTRFGGGRALRYRLAVDRAATAISASFVDGVIEVCLPAGAARQWYETDLVSLSASQPLSDGPLRILIEKDYACLTSREGEDESDNFPNPAAHC